MTINEAFSTHQHNPAQNLIRDDGNYRKLRRKVVPMFASAGGVMLFWCNMWLGIESDGYTHS